MNLPAFIFDLNGTMVDDMEFHADAWFDILNNDLKAGLNREEVKREMYGKNSELLDRIFGENSFTTDKKNELSVAKERRYQAAFLPHLSLIKGLRDFLQKAYDNGIPMAIGTAAIPMNIDFVVDKLNIRHFFKAIVSADDVANSKPDPETFITCAGLLDVSPENCIVFEDAPKGVEAAKNAGMSCVVITTMHEKDEFRDYDNIISFIHDYTSLVPDTLKKNFSNSDQ